MHSYIHPIHPNIAYAIAASQCFASRHEAVVVSFDMSALVDFLHANRDIFAWKPSDMPGILREVIEHALKIKPGSKPVKQRLRRFDE